MSSMKKQSSIYEIMKKYTAKIDNLYRNILFPDFYM